MPKSKFNISSKDQAGKVVEILEKMESDARVEATLTLIVARIFA